MERSDRRASGGRDTRRRVAAVALMGVFVLLLTACLGDGTYRVGYGPGQFRPGATYSTAGGEGLTTLTESSPDLLTEIPHL
jgi:hypothetical protein